jgi:capsular polysaccharide export protein
VPGQVEDDLSVQAGGHGLASNLELVRRVRLAEPDAEIWFRPHPDVDAGHRKGAVPDAAILAHADRVVRGGGMAPARCGGCGARAHLAGRVRGLAARPGGDVPRHAVLCRLGIDARPCARTRAARRALTLDALVAGVLILYPRYLDPVSGLPCPPEVLVERMARAQANNRLRWIGPLRRMQGRVLATLRGAA